MKIYEKKSMKIYQTWYTNETKTSSTTAKHKHTQKETQTFFLFFCFFSFSFVQSVVATCRSGEIFETY